VVTARLKLISTIKISVKYLFYTNKLIAC
jgi:hypothetical protein